MTTEALNFPTGSTTLPRREVLFEELDEGWGRALPVTLITHSNNQQDLHRQTGTQFEAHIEKARGLLRERGLKVGDVEFIGPTGAYLPVTAG